MLSSSAMTLTKAIAAYQEQLVLVLPQQSGFLTALATSPPTSANGDLNFPPPAKKRPPVTDVAPAGQTGQFLCGERG